ncbi:MAG: arylesterase [Elusimicrobia bacterium]|jgi:acyl-CoA thioesterase-1|nr:arylesterase [Elusimicrobiota bacterium]MBP8004320.1 arylesterase [Elusimicrobiota bacterium]
MNKALGVASLFFLFACRPPAPPPAPPAALHVLCFGDSLTAGKDLLDPDRQSYPAVLERRLKEKGHSVRVTNAGQSGDTSFDARARLDYSLTDRPDLVVICLGSNDMFQGKRLEDLEANLTDIARRCRTAGARAVICRMRIFVNFGFGWTARYERIFPRAARAAGAALAPFPLEGVAAQPSMNLPDGIHPNPAGYEKFVDNIFETVEEEIKAVQRKKR